MIGVSGVSITNEIGRFVGLGAGLSNRFFLGLAGSGDGDFPLAFPNALAGRVEIESEDEAACLLLPANMLRVLDTSLIGLFTLVKPLPLEGVKEPAEDPDEEADEDVEIAGEAARPS